MASTEGEKLAPVCPAVTFTPAGTLTIALLLDSETVVPPEGAIPLIVTVQLTVPGPVTVPGVQLRLMICSCCCVDGETVSPVVVVLPFSPAVSVALTAAAVPPAEAMKVTKFCPAATVTLAGTVTVALLLDSETTVPPEGAFPLIVTVQLAVPGPVTVAGVQLRLVTCNCCVDGDTIIPVVVVLPFSPAISVALTAVAVPPVEAMKVTKFCPAATVTLAGTVTFALLLDSETTIPPEGAFPLIVTVQLAVPGPVTLAGVQLRLVTCSCCCVDGETVRPVVVVLPFNPASSVALTAVAVPPAEAMKVTKFCPAATVTLAGTVTVVLLLDSETTVPPEGAFPLIVTVQLAVPGPVTVAGVQLTLVTCSCCVDGDTLSPFIVLLPFRLAVSVAFTVVDVDPADAVKTALACPAATVTLAGTVTVALLLDSETTVPPEGTFPLIVAVQLAVPGPVTVAGAQLTLVTCSCGGDTVSPVVVLVPFRLAVNVAFTVVDVDPAEAVKTALACPAATVTLAGTVTVALLLDSETAVPPEGAFPLIVTVQLDVPSPVTTPGVQLRLVTCSCWSTARRSTQLLCCFRSGWPSVLRSRSWTLTQPRP